MTLNKSTWLLLLLTVLLSACGNKKAQTKKYYRLSPVASTTSDTIRPETLVIKRPTALSILGGRPMVATQTDGSLVQLSHHFWLESPKVLLRDQLFAWAKQHWQAVNNSVPADGTYQLLETRILAFEKQQNQARVSLEFSLFDTDRQLLFNQQFNHRETITGEGYKAFVQAINLALEQILLQLSTQLNHAH